MHGPNTLLPQPSKLSESSGTPSTSACENHRSADGTFRRGDWVKVRSLEEILATLDEEGKLDGLPFMPEMIPLAGRILRVHRRADRTCVEGVGNRRMEGTVLLEGIRCDGSAHEGCQRKCLFFWKEAWLTPADGPAKNSSMQAPNLVSTVCQRLPVRKGERHFCQSTELAGATAGELRNGNLQCYLKDFRIGETTIRRFLHVLWIAVAKRVWPRLSGKGYYERPVGELKRTTNESLNLQPGELVEVKSLEEIKQTLDASGKNRGMTFDAEMGLHCGKRFRVLGPVQRMIAEETGKMLTLKNTVLLQGLTCEGICVYNCPRANYFFWRECWLARVEETGSSPRSAA